MAIRSDQVQVEYLINGKQAINELGKLEVEMSDLTKKNKELQKSLNDGMGELGKKTKSIQKDLDYWSKGLADMDKNNVNYGFYERQVEKYKNQLKAVQQEEAEYRKELKQNEEQIKQNIEAQQGLKSQMGLEGLTNRQLNTERAATLRLLDNLTKGTDEYAEAQKRLHAIEKERDGRIADKRMPKEGKGFGDLLNDKFDFKSMLTGGALFGLAAGAASKALDVVVSEATEAVQRAREKSKALSGMAAITGLDLQKDAADIRFFGDSAEYMAAKFNMSVPDVIQGMSKIGSIKPELLKAKESLAALTEEAITLSKADGMLSVEDAAIALVGSLNQFDKGADQSTRFMNVLAASASAGGAEINEVSASFKVAGAVLSASNISFEQSNALVQVLAKRQLLGAEAGTALRNVFSKLMIANDELNPSIVGVNTALDNLAKLSPQEIVKMFGQENLVAAKTLIDLRGEVSKLTDEMTGTSEAVDQAKKRMDNLDEDLNTLGKAWDRLFDFSDNQSSGFRSIIQWLSKVFNYISDIRKNWQVTWADFAGPIPSIFKFFGASNRASDAREAAERKAAGDASRKQGMNDYLDGTKESNLNQFEGKTQADKQRAYTNKFLADARKTYGELNQKLIEAKKTDPKKAAELQVELARVAGQVVAGKNALEDLRKVEAQNKKMVEDIKRGQKKEKEDKKKNGHKSEEERQAEDRINNHVKIEQEVAKMKIDAIEDDRTRELAQAKWRRDQEKEEREKLVKEKKMSQADFNAWLKASEARSLTEIRDINKKHDERLQKEKLEVAVRLSRAVKALQLQDAQFRLQQAEATPGDDLAVLKARQNLSLISEKQTLEEKEAIYLQDREKYKHNKDVLTTLEAAYQKEVKEIQNRGQRERLQMLLDYTKQTEARTRNAKLEALSLESQQYEFNGDIKKAVNARLDALKIQQEVELKATKLTEQEKTNILKKYQLLRDQINRDAATQQYERERATRENGLSMDIQEAERKGQTGKATDLKLDMLESQMQAELRVANLTEQEKTNILRKYQMERDALMDQSFRQQATQWLEVAQAAVQGISQLHAVQFDNEETRNNDAKARQMKRLDEQKEKGILSDKEYSEAKEKLDEEYEEKQRKLRKKRAESEKKDALFAAGIQMALNILKAGINPFAIALATVTGLAQIAAIASREIPEYYEGGFPDGQNQIISVNEKGQEWIAPNWQLNDPVSRRALDWLEYRRANKIVGSNGPNLQDIPTSVNTPSSSGSSPVIVNIPGMEQIPAALNLLTERLGNLEARVNYDHLRESLDRPAEIQADALAPSK